MTALIHAQPCGGTVVERPDLLPYTYERESGKIESIPSLVCTRCEKVIEGDFELEPLTEDQMQGIETTERCPDCEGTGVAALKSFEDWEPDEWELQDCGRCQGQGQVSVETG